MGAFVPAASGVCLNSPCASSRRRRTRRGSYHPRRPGTGVILRVASQSLHEEFAPEYPSSWANCSIDISRICIRRPHGLSAATPDGEVKNSPALDLDDVGNGTYEMLGTCAPLIKGFRRGRIWPALLATIVNNSQPAKPNPCSEGQPEARTVRSRTRTPERLKVVETQR